MEKSRTNKLFILFNIILAIGLLIITIIFWITDLDIKTIQTFYLENDEWMGFSNPYYSLYYFPMNAIIFAIPLLIGFPLLIMSFSKRPFFKKIRAYRNHSALLLISTMLGAGLFNSVILKLIFARPRPGAYFDGNMIYYRPFEVATEYWFNFDMSFPSGHVSIAFVLLTFFFAFNYSPKLWQKGLKWGVGVIIPIITGTSMILSRMSYGHHYLSDGIWAGAFTYYFALTFYYILKIPEKNLIIKENGLKESVRMTRKDLLIIILSIIVPIVFAGYFIIQFNGLTSV